MQLNCLRVLFFAFPILPGLSYLGVLAHVSDAEQNLYAITLALSGIPQHLEALPTDSVSSDAFLVPLVLCPTHSFLISLAEYLHLNSKPDRYVV
jgi:hypothetical protein